MHILYKKARLWSNDPFIKFIWQHATIVSYESTISHESNIS